MRWRQKEVFHNNRIGFLHYNRPDFNYVRHKMNVDNLKYQTKRSY